MVTVNFDGDVTVDYHDEVMETTVSIRRVGDGGKSVSVSFDVCSPVDEPDPIDSFSVELTLSRDELFRAVKVLE